MYMCVYIYIYISLFSLSLYVYIYIDNTNNRKLYVTTNLCNNSINEQLRQRANIRIAKQHQHSGKATGCSWTWQAPT